MIINDVHIKQFRGFNDVQFSLGKNLTVIAGQNGTQKTTVLGMLSQPFSITDKENPLFGEMPLCGGNYRSSFAEKFKLSEAFDKAQCHEWTLKLNNATEPEFTVESIKRDASSEAIRFWQKGKRSKGSGYIQLPVIYLSLSRLFPIGEDTGIGSSTDISLTPDEFKFYKDWHDKILIIPDGQMTSVDYLKSKQKNTLGANTSYYDWRMNSAGQDNIGKILLAILSFKRLKDKHKDSYKGGILAIDELDATLYPASQLKLVEALRKFSSQYNIQIVFTTHSLTILEEMCVHQENPKISGQVKVIYLQKEDSHVKAIEDISIVEIKNKLNVTLSPKQKTKKIPAFAEDKEGEILAKAILKRRGSPLQFVECTMGCSNYIELAKKKIDGFKYLQSIIILDGDVKSESSKMRELKKHKNFLVLPGIESPERLIAKFLHNLPEESLLWNGIYDGYTKQLVFRDYSIREIQTDREKAKAWFNSQKQYWGRGCAGVINLWISENQEEVSNFINEYNRLIKKYI
jgi:energy-coupling factor transporter ATP-binding protein EcfA2